jgi:hypothetical protein
MVAQVRKEAAKEIIDHLPEGAEYREGTSEGWLEIKMPPPQQPPVLVVPVEQSESPAGPSESTELPSLPWTLKQHDDSDP